MTIPNNSDFRLSNYNEKIPFKQKSLFCDQNTPNTLGKNNQWKKTKINGTFFLFEKEGAYLPLEQHGADQRPERECIQKNMFPSLTLPCR